jgi:hypothetical protein
MSDLTSVWQSRHLELYTCSPRTWQVVQLLNPSSPACALVSSPGEIWAVTLRVRAKARKPQFSK